MKIKVTTVSGEETQLEDIISLSITETAGVPCGCLAARVKGNNPGGEIVSVKAYLNGKPVFNGFCDTQRVSEGEDSFETFIYARSTAALLVDNEAQPYTFFCPSAKQLCLNYAEKLGFVCSLPEIFSQDRYQVSKGTSAFGAINNFVSFITGKPIYVSAENELKLLETGKKPQGFAGYKIKSVCAVTNRSEPISAINYKKRSEPDYSLHTKSALSDDIKINRTKFLNLSVLPGWQREYCVLDKIKKSFEDYKILEITVDGYFHGGLYELYNYSGKSGVFENYLLYEKKYACDSRGEYTKLVLKKQIDIKEITYVD